VARRWSNRSLASPAAYLADHTMGTFDARICPGWNELVTRAPFHVELSKVYPLDAAWQALRDVQHHHVGKLAIKIDSV